MKQHRWLIIAWGLVVLTLMALDFWFRHSSLGNPIPTWYDWVKISVAMVMIAAVISIAFWIRAHSRRLA